MAIVKLTAAGVIEAALLLAPHVDAICFAGGSCYRLEAASGVMAGLLERRRGSNRWNEIAYVPGAIVFDFGGRENAVHPDRELGVAMAAGDLAWDAVLAAEQHADPDPEKR
jgi:L-aminopeptidase/D-esterase-like protein